MKKVAVVHFQASLDIDAVINSLKIVKLDYIVIKSSSRTLPENVVAVVLPGGFSYGDYLRPGAIAATEPLIKEIARQAELGMPVLGICNGFQICCESGLLPGSLLKNKSNLFFCNPVKLKIENKYSPWLSNLNARSLKLILKSSYGRYYVDKTTLKNMIESKQIACSYSKNPNGSTASIAAISNKAGNVLGIMPHPEYSSRIENFSGTALFRSLKENLL
jgi:phosphoribosylformylglycinamidine synthase